MLLTFTAAALFASFLPFVLLAARPSREHQKMRARFAILQTEGAGGFSTGTQTDLLRNAGAHPGFYPAAAVERISRWLHLELLLLQAASRQTPWRLLRMCGLCGLATGSLALAATHNPLWTALSGAIAAALPLLQLRFRARQRRDAMNKALPQVLDMISRALRAGHSLPAALGIVAEEAAEPARSAFSEVFQKQKFGLPLRDALLELIGRFPSQDLKVFVTAVLVQRDTGGNLVQILERTSTVIRERLKLQGDVRVHTAQGRMTGWILCLLPILMLGMLMLSDPGYPKLLIDDPLGRKLLYGGVLLLCVGALLIRRIVKAIEV